VHSLTIVAARLMREAHKTERITSFLEGCLNTSVEVAPSFGAPCFVVQVGIRLSNYFCSMHALFDPFTDASSDCNWCPLVDRIIDKHPRALSRTHKELCFSARCESFRGGEGRVGRHRRRLWARDGDGARRTRRHQASQQSRIVVCRHANRIVPQAVKFPPRSPPGDTHTAETTVRVIGLPPCAGRSVHGRRY
jgi:hypothetical protein